MSKPLIAVTMGDPAGVGPEICLQLLANEEVRAIATPLACGNTVVFNVALGATKPAIKKAVEGLFGVKVKSVNTLVRKGKQRRFKGQLAGLEDGNIDRVDETTAVHRPVLECAHGRWLDEFGYLRLVTCLANAGANPFTVQVAARSS